MGILSEILVKKPKHSNFNLSKKIRTSMPMGLLIPIYNTHVLPGDRFKIDLSSVLKSYPTLAPIMGSMKLQFDYFFAPWRLYVKKFRDNRAGFVADEDIAFPYISAPKQADDFTSTEEVKGVVAQGSLFQYLYGLPTGWYNAVKTSNTAASNNIPGKFNGFPLLSYLDIFRNYYANPQEKDYAYINKSGQFEYARADWALRGDLLTLTNAIDKISAGDTDVLRALLSSMGSVTDSGLEGLWDEFTKSPLSGLICRTYLPDHFSAWLDVEQYASIQQKSRILTSQVNANTNYITVDQIRYATKLARYLEKGLLVGGRYGDSIRAQFGVTPNRELDIPEYLGGTSTDVIFEDVVSTAETGTSGNGPLGSLGGRGVGFLGSRDRWFNFTEYGTFMVMMSLVPRVDYYQGIPKLHRKMYLSDVFTPDLDNIGMQDLTLDEIYASSPAISTTWSDQYNPMTQAIGKQPAWTEYMTDTNRVYGEFTTDLNYWTLSRSFLDGVRINAGYYGTPRYSAYIYPGAYNSAFADQSPSAQNFQVQIALDVLASRPISKRLMPTLM